MTNLSNRIRHLVPGVTFSPQTGTCKLRDDNDGVGAKIVHWDAVALGRARPSEAELLAVTDLQIASAKANRHRNTAKARWDAREAMTLRAVTAALVDELNVLRQWLAALKAEVAASTNFTNLKARIAQLPATPDRTLAQAKTAITNAINAGTVDT